jgi:aminopeptidase N
VRIATAQYDAANNMTDRAAALGALLAGAAAGATDAAERALATSTAASRTRRW